MLKIGYNQLNLNVQRFFDRNLKEKCEVLRTTVVDNSYLENSKYLGNDLFLNIRTINEKILLGVLLWYMPEELRFTTNLWLEEHWGGEHKEVKTVVLTSKASALGYLLVQEKWGDNDFFGNILQKSLLRNILKMNLKYRTVKRPKEKIRKRGFHDKGSLRPSHLSIIFDQKKLRSNKRQMEIFLLEQEILLKLQGDIEERLLLEQVS